MANSEDQMSNLFEEGGIADDGMNVDPVSGNDIPPGSMAQEVRDDVPAQLSEGEYVVPADVLRFYGVKFFEDLRAEAKQGMMQMEADGRIGGEPVPTGGPTGGPEQEMSDLTPEEMAVLQEMGMAVGGMVPQPTQSTNPSMQQQQMYQQPSPVAMGNTGYAEGGGVRGYNEAGVVSNKPGLLSQYGMGFSFNQDPVVNTVMLYSPDGLTSQPFSLPAQQVQYDAKIAEGWRTTQVATTTETSVGVEEERKEGGGLGDGGQAPENDPGIATGPVADAVESLADDAVDAAIDSFSSTPVGMAVNLGLDAVTGKDIAGHLGRTDDDDNDTSAEDDSTPSLSGTISDAISSIAEALGFSGKDNEPSDNDAAPSDNDAAPSDNAPADSDPATNGDAIGAMNEGGLVKRRKKNKKRKK